MSRGTSPPTALRKSPRRNPPKRNPPKRNPPKRNPPKRTPPTPMRVDARRVVAIGTACWLAAAVILLASWSWLSHHDHRNWIATCLVGAALGVLGIALMGRHHNKGRL